MRERATVWFDLVEKDRPGVVIEVRDEIVRVAYGRHEEREGWEGAPVRRETRAGKKWPLRDPITYFYGSNTLWAPPRELRPGKAECVRELHNEIRRLVEEHDARAQDEPADPDR